jgi:uncharacterized RDD family membrane protein YckC
VENLDNPYAPPRAATDVEEAIRAARAARGADKLWVDASKGRRLANLVIDIVILDVALIPLTGKGIAPVDWLINYAVMFAYYALTEGFLGRTPAKFLTRTRVISIRGGPPTFAAVLLRSLVRLAPFEPFSFLGGEGWHDRASRTRVVRAI